MKTFNLTIFLLLLSLFFTCGPFQPDQKEENTYQSEYAAQLSRIFDGSLFDYFQNHNQALDIIDALTQDGLLEKKPATLIHFDSHSDMYRLSREEDIYTLNYGHGISNYINSLILNGRVEEIFWVIPDVSRTPENQELFWNPSTGIDEHFVMFNGPKTQTFYVDEKDIDIFFDRPYNYNIDPARYRKITFHKVILEELRLEHYNRPIIIDIDADYFSNNGYDTANEMVVPYNINNITRFLSTLENLNIRPVLTMGSLSPDYTHDEDKIALERFFQDIGASTQKGDYLIGYRHHDIFGDTIIGSNIRRRSKDLYQGIYQLSYIDLRTNTPDYFTPINDTSVEYMKVNEKIQMLLGIPEQKSNTLLLNWDGDDGHRDSAVHYYQIEQNVQNRNGYPLTIDKGTERSFHRRARFRKLKSISKEEYLNQRVK